MNKGKAKKNPVRILAGDLLREECTKFESSLMRIEERLTHQYNDISRNFEDLNRNLETFIRNSIEKMEPPRKRRKKNDDENGHYRE